MSVPPTLSCRAERRRSGLFGNAEWNGLDYLDVADDQGSLCVHFFGKIPDGIGPDNIEIRGGRRIRGIRAVQVRVDPSGDEDLDDCLRIDLDRPGDFSTYSLCLSGVPGIDPRFACLDFSFKTGCASDLDCGRTEACPPEAPAEPAIDYLAKDYASFRQLVTDRLALIMPDWRERHAPDLGVTLVELLAYAGDHLSYYQDAVATEAYLGTARQRISIARHLRLIDYALNDGCNARAFVTVTTDAPFTLEPGDVFVTACPGIESGEDGFTDAALLAQASGYLVFQPLGLALPYKFRAEHSRIAFHDWSDGECCLPKGATSATLVDHANAPDEDSEAKLALAEGDYLIFEEVLSPVTGNAADADPEHRHVIRLSRATRVYDALTSTLVWEVEWPAEDALPFPLCLSVRRASPDCGEIKEVSVARGNVVPVDHGRTVVEPLDPVLGRDIPGDCACEGSIIEMRQSADGYHPALARGPLTFAEPLTGNSAAALTARDPRLALPQVALDGEGRAWQPRRDLFSSGGDDRRFVAEVDDEGIAHLRFGDGVHGRSPEVGIALAATYRSGNGAAGNVGREAIAHLVLRDRTVHGAKISVRNPLAARGGSDPEAVAEARMFAPGMIQARRERAIVAEDYAELALRVAGLQGAAASLRWSGSWHEARVAVDSMGSADPAPKLLEEVEQSLGRYRRIGHDLAVAAARSVPLLLRLHVCVLPHYARSDVRAELLALFGPSGFFHPDTCRFGESVALSAIVSAAMAVDGVETVRVDALHRLNEPEASALATGRLALRPGEVARLDNDPDFPENGQLKLDLGGGR